MNQQNSPFPLFFTLERVENGYILTAKENTGLLRTKSAPVSVSCSILKP